MVTIGSIAAVEFLYQVVGVVCCAWFLWL